MYRTIDHVYTNFVKNIKYMDYVKKSKYMDYVKPF